MKLNSRFLNFLFIAYLLSSFIGCATAPYLPLAAPGIPQGIPGTYHRVERGQTLWRISKMYNVDLDEVARINHIPDASTIEQGQLVFIPTTRKPEPIPQKYASEDFIWPIRGRVISSFGQTFNNMINKGVNIQPYGNLNVVAAREGEVVFYSDNFGSFGKTIIIDHGDGLSTVYTRNSEIYIKVGDNVGRGTVIAKVGCAGRDRTAYLHFEIRKGHVPQNPYYFLP